MAAAERPWLAGYPAEPGEALRLHGVDPAAHAYNVRVAELAAAGHSGDLLAAMADELARAYVAEEEEPEDEPPPEFDMWVEDLIDDAIEKRHRDSDDGSK